MKLSRTKFWVLSGLVVVILGAMAVPQYAKVRPGSVLRAHVNALLHINQAILYYAKEHDGVFPTSLNKLADYDPHIRKVEDSVHGDIYYLRPPRKLSECAPGDVVLFSTSPYGTAMAFIDGTARAVNADWGSGPQLNENLPTKSTKGNVSYP